MQKVLPIVFFNYFKFFFSCHKFGQADLDNVLHAQTIVPALEQEFSIEPGASAATMKALGSERTTHYRNKLEFTFAYITDPPSNQK